MAYNKSLYYEILMSLLASATVAITLLAITEISHLTAICLI